MLNLKVGTSAEVSGSSCIVTNAGQVGHAVYGPYEYLEPGRYIVEFNIKLADVDEKTDDLLCAIIDVTADFGRASVASKEIYYSQMRAGKSQFSLIFNVRKRARFEYRVWVSGSSSLLIDDHRTAIAVPEDKEDLQAVLAEHRFPDEEGSSVPFFVENRVMLRSLYERGIRVNIIRGATVLTVDGISLFAKSQDDLTFIGEIFYERAYNFRVGGDVCVIDIGMNIGLASLTFAQKPEVREVHAFEPFRNTFERALDNLSLNPRLAARIYPHNCGLTDRDWEGSVMVEQHADSGAMSTVAGGTHSGTPMHVVLQDAAATLRPIIERARSNQLGIVMKIDCEGSEFAIFRSIAEAGLLPYVAAFMVEWHAMFEGKTQEDLIRPLLDHGFAIFDRSAPTGNGFFYAARIA